MQNQTNPKPSGAPMAKLVLVAAIIVSLGALFGAIGYLAKNKAAKIQHPQVSPAPVINETADWETYRNEKYGFEFKYPMEWLYKIVSEKQVEFREREKAYSIEESDTYAIGIFLDENISNLTAEQIAEARKSKSSFPVEIKTLIVGNTDAAQTVDYLQQSTIIVKDNKIYKIVTPNFGNNDLNKSVREIYDKMLSTFKFIEKDETADWKTYRNEKYEFEVTLLDSWKGYSTLTESWSGTTLDGNSAQYQGPKIIVRNPKWTESQIWQDIPILVFTKDEWQLIEAENLNISAAPIGPSKLGENQKYVFALPSRWVGFDDALGQNEAQEIAKTFKAISFFPDETADWKTYRNEEYGLEVKYPEDWLKNKVDLFPDYMKEAVISSLSHTFFIPQVKRIPEDVWVSISVSPCKTFFCDPREEVEEPYRKTIKQSTIKGQSIFVSDNRFEGERDLSYILVNDEKTQQVWLTLSIHHGRQNGIEYLTDEEIQPELETFNQILSTFKFIEKDQVK
ncbi:hypothetical protein KKB43_02295 [Patescibacteria group bacterium]|nr:hypothetical protein [Patescibacteria group bacterium]MBU4579822.1 hypothetical protein [Patescibacteria group bacterium]